MSHPSREDDPQTLGQRLEALGWRGSVEPIRPESDAELQRQEQEAFEGEARRRRDQRWQEIARPRFSVVSWADVRQPPAVLAQLQAWLHACREQKADANLILTGDHGVGKTYAALALAKELHYDDRTVAFLPTVELLDQLRPPESADIKTFVEFDILVLDDLGAEKVSDWTVERLYAVINGRWLARRPTIVTTNEGPEGIKEAISPRTYDRLADNAVAIAIAGTSRRRRRTQGDTP